MREKCLHKIVSEKYHDEGVLFWTFFNYLDNCFVEDGPIASSLADCYDWSTVLINNNEEVGTLNDCVEGSFATRGDHDSDNGILKRDREWA